MAFSYVKGGVESIERFTEIFSTTKKIQIFLANAEDDEKRGICFPYIFDEVKIVRMLINNYPNDNVFVISDSKSRWKENDINYLLSKEIDDFPENSDITIVILDDIIEKESIDEIMKKFPRAKYIIISTRLNEDSDVKMFVLGSIIFSRLNFIPCSITPQQLELYENSRKKDRKKYMNAYYPEDNDLPDLGSDSWITEPDIWRRYFPKFQAILEIIRVNNECKKYIIYSQYVSRYGLDFIEKLLRLNDYQNIFRYTEKNKKESKKEHSERLKQNLISFENLSNDQTAILLTDLQLRRGARCFSDLIVVDNHQKDTKEDVIELICDAKARSVFILFADDEIEKIEDISKFLTKNFEKLNEQINIQRSNA